MKLGQILSIFKLTGLKAYTGGIGLMLAGIGNLLKAISDLFFLTANLFTDQVDLVVYFETAPTIIESAWAFFLGLGIVGVRAKMARSNL